MTEPQPPPAPEAPSSLPNSQSSIFSKRSRRQLSYFFAGASLCYLTSIVTRRAIVRRLKSSIPKFYQQSNQPVKVHGQGEALQALGIATMYVVSVGITAATGLLWAFDISNLEELRFITRKGVGVDPEMKDQNAEEELEEFIASVLARRELKMFGGKDFKTEVSREFEKEKLEGREKDKKGRRDAT